MGDSRHMVDFVASRSAGPFVGRHFLLERHFAGEMISVGKARRCPFNADTIDFFFLVREKGGFVRTLRTPLGYVPDSEVKNKRCHGNSISRRHEKEKSSFLVIGPDSGLATKQNSNS